MGRDDLLELLRDLGGRLQQRGLSADLYVVGGAAIALAFDHRRVTRDIDAAFHPADTVREEASRLAEQRGLPPDWLSSAAIAFAPPGRDEDAVALDLPGLAVSVASPEHLLAMKLAAGRERDVTDLVVLFEALSVTRPEQALEIARRLYGEESAILTDPDQSYLWLAEDVLELARRRRDDLAQGTPSD
jgi:hypothetical protein